jgi:hypothetical protein
VFALPMDLIAPLLERDPAQNGASAVLARV